MGRYDKDELEQKLGFKKKYIADLTTNECRLILNYYMEKHNQLTDVDLMMMYGILRQLFVLMEQQNSLTH